MTRLSAVALVVLAVVPVIVAQLGIDCFPSYDPCKDNVANHWGTQCQSPLCVYGKRQSPINLNVYGVKPTTQPRPLIINFQDTAATLSNRGAFFAWDIPADSTNTDEVSGGPKILGSIHKLKQFSTHTPSEHRIGGIMYPAELQFYSMNAKGQYIGLSILVVTGERSAFLDMVISNLWLVPGQGNATDVELDVSTIWPELGYDLSYYTYNGSLTVPPCTESVTWIIFSTPLSAAPDQVDALFIAKSRRDIQPTGDRKVYYYSNTFYPPAPNTTIPQNNVLYAVPAHVFATDSAWTVMVVMLCVIAGFIGLVFYAYAQSANGTYAYMQGSGPTTAEPTAVEAALSLKGVVEADV